MLYVQIISGSFAVSFVHLSTGVFNLILLNVRAAFITPSPKSRNVFDQEFPWPWGLCLAEVPKQGTYWIW